MWQKWSFYFNFFRQKARNFIRNFKLDRHVVIFLVFFLISAFLWLIQALNKNYITEINLQTVFSGTYNSLTVRDEASLDRKLRIQIEGTGYDIFSHKFDFFPKKVSISLYKLHLIRDKESPKHYFYTNTIKSMLQLSLGQKMKLLEVKPDTLVFWFTKYIEKEIFIKANFKIKPASGFAIKNTIKIVPDRIKITGPDYLVNELDSIQLNSVDRHNIDKTIDENVSFDLPDRITANVEAVRFFVEIAEFTEIINKLMIEPVNVPDSLNLITFPAQLNLIYKVFISDYKKVNKLNVVVDYHQAKLGQKYLEVYLNSQAAHIFDIRYSPNFVEYLIEEKK